MLVSKAFHNIDDENNDLDKKEIKYDIAWTKNFKNLNKLLGVKGVIVDNSLDIFKFKYLIFSVATNSLSSIRSSDRDYIDYNYLRTMLMIQKIIILDKYIKYNQLIINIFIWKVFWYIFKI